MKALARRHYCLLAMIFGAAIALRCWHLGTKPLWLDEVIGAIFTLGRGIDDIPLNTIFPISDLFQLFAFQPGQSCAQITQTVATESVHPPFFFCLQYQWLQVWQLLRAMTSIEVSDSLVMPQWTWALRSLPALFGVLGVLGVYILGRLAMSPPTGLIAAALMAVSPFAVYLSQEARHYTLPMLLTILSIVVIVYIQQKIQQNQPLLPRVWVAWIGLNSIGLYTHYFFLLDFIAQLMALGSWMIWNAFGCSCGASSGMSAVQRSGLSLKWAGWSVRSRFPLTLKSLLCSPRTFNCFWRYVAQLIVSSTIVVMLYLPWLPTLLQHIQRPETDWLKPYKPDWSDRLAPLYQTLMGWILMVINFPVESQPLAIAIPSAIVMLLVSGWLGWRILQGLKSHWQLPHHRPVLCLLFLLLASLILQTFAIVYLLDKDITAIPRYNFISYPVLLVLFAIGLTSVDDTASSNRKSMMKIFATSPLFVALLVGILSTLLVVHGIVFQKGYYPNRVAATMTMFPEEPLVVAVSYRSLQEVALGLSFALELQKRFPTVTQDTAYMLFIDRTDNYDTAWQQLKNAPHSIPLPLNLWAIASPGMKTKDYPTTLKIRRPNRKAKTTCTIDPAYFYRIGFPYQLFRCPNAKPNKS